MQGDKANHLIQTSARRTYQGHWVATNVKTSAQISVHLRGVDLTGANLSNSTLRDTDLTGSRFYMANLHNAKLIGSDFTDVMFLDGSTRGAQFHSAKFIRTLFYGLVPFQVNRDG